MAKLNFFNIPEKVVKPSFEEFTDLRLERLQTDYLKVKNAKQALASSYLDSSELSLINHSLSSVSSFHSKEIRMESQGTSHDSLKLKCEGMVSGFVETVKRFIDWLIERFKNIFSGKTYDGGPVIKERKTSVGSSVPEVRKTFRAKELNKYFSYETENEAEYQILQILKNLGHVESFFKVFKDFPFEKWLLPEAERLKNSELLERFNKEVLDCGIDIDNCDLSDIAGGDRYQGFHITPKLILGLIKDENNGFKVFKLPAVKTKDCEAIDIVYKNFSKGIGGALNKVAMRCNNLAPNTLKLLQSRLKILDEIKANFSSDMDLMENVMTIGKIYNHFVTFMKEIETLFNDFTVAMDRIEEK